MPEDNPPAKGDLSAAGAEKTGPENLPQEHAECPRHNREPPAPLKVEEKQKGTVADHHILVFDQGRSFAGYRRMCFFSAIFLTSSSCEGWDENVDFRL